MSSPILMISCVQSNNTYIYEFAITPNFISIIRNHPVQCKAIHLLKENWYCPKVIPVNTSLGF